MEYFWISLPFIATLFVFIFGRAGIYSTVSGGLFFNPHIDYFDDVENKVIERKFKNSNLKF